MKSQTKKQLVQAKNIVGIMFALTKSFFFSVTQVAWGIAGIFGLNLILAYILTNHNITIPFEVNQTFIKLEEFVINNIMGFVVIFFLLFSYFEIKEVLK